MRVPWDTCAEFQPSRERFYPAITTGRGFSFSVPLQLIENVRSMRLNDVAVDPGDVADDFLLNLRCRM